MISCYFVVLNDTKSKNMFENGLITINLEAFLIMHLCHYRRNNGGLMNGMQKLI